jgi:hypothetical protein
MVLRMRAMKQAVAAATALLALTGLALWPPAPAVAQNVGPAENATLAGDGAAQKRAHPPAQIRVHPLARSYPGPDAVRQCASWLATEYRPSGTVIVPKMRCWWERG